MNDFQIPPGWQKQTLGKIASIRIGKTPPRDREEFWDSDKQSQNVWLSIKDMTSRYLTDSAEYITDKAIRELNIPFVEKGMILLSFKLTIGKVAIAQRGLRTNEAIASIRILDSNHMNSVFLSYGLSYWNLMQNVDQAIKGATLNKKKLRELEFIIPINSSEQHTIAKVLTTVDDAIDQTEALIRKYQRIKQGLMQDLLTRGVDENGELRCESKHRFKYSEIGPIPYEWEIIDFEHLVNNITARWIPRNTGNSFPCLNLENIESETGQVNGFSDAIENASTKTIFQKGDILFGKLRPYLKKYWIADVDGVCTTEILVFRAQRSIDPRYIYYLVQNERFINYTISSSFGTKMPRTSWDIIKRYKIGKPDFEEQKRISQILLNIDSQIEMSRIELSKLKLLKEGLMQDLLTGKVRVNSLLGK